MENNRNRNEQREPSSATNQDRLGQNGGSSNGFEGMNFEEQRSSYKNSDGAGVNDSQKGSRNGGNDRQDV